MMQLGSKAFETWCTLDHTLCTKCVDVLGTLHLNALIKNGTGHSTSGLVRPDSPSPEKPL